MDTKTIIDTEEGASKALFALEILDGQIMELIGALPDELTEAGTDPEKYLSRICGLLADIKTFLRGLRGYTGEHPEQFASDINGAERHLDAIREEIRKD